MTNRFPWSFLAIPVLLGLVDCRERSSSKLRTADVTNAATVSSASDGFGAEVKISMDDLRHAAFARCQAPWVKPVVIPVPVLDPPVAGGQEALGMTYQEELEVHVPNILDKNNFYLFAKPRAALNTLAVDMYLDGDNSGTYKKVTWERVNPDYTSDKITPPVGDCPATMPQDERKKCAQAAIPDAGRYLTELIIGHVSPMGGWPQIFDLRSSAYVRYSGFPPMNAGASYRLGAHRLWSIKLGETTATEFNDQDFTSPEDFPVVRTLFTAVKDDKTATTMVVVESELFCGALSLDMTVGMTPEIVTDGYWYTRADYDWKKDSNTGLAAYSSMFWMDEKGTPGYSGDEAHDSDTMRVRFNDGTEKMQLIEMPTAKLKVYDFSDDTGGKKVTGWSLANEDRDPLHYRYFDAALGASNFINRASYRVDVLDSNIEMGARLYVHWTDGEYLDNIVGVSTIRQDIKKAATPDEFVHFKYKTSAYLEGYAGCASVLDASNPQHIVQLNAWGSKFLIAETKANKELPAIGLKMTKMDPVVTPSGAPQYECKDGATAIAYWPGVARVNSEYFTVDKIIP